MTNKVDITIDTTLIKLEQEVKDWEKYLKSKGCTSKHGYSIAKTLWFFWARMYISIGHDTAYVYGPLPLAQEIIEEWCKRKGITKMLIRHESENYGYMCG